MKIQEAAENYLECILIIGKEKGQVRSVDVAHRLQVTKPTVSITMKQFRENGYVETDEKGILTLTEKGREIAERIYERHVVLTELLLSLGVDEETAREDFKRDEHGQPVFSSFSVLGNDAYRREQIASVTFVGTLSGAGEGAGWLCACLGRAQRRAV